MPELPEVETVRRSLLDFCTGKTIENIEVITPSVLATAGFAELGRGRSIEGIDRRGKFLLLRLSGDLRLGVHLRMTGRLLHFADAVPPEPHTHVIIHFKNGGGLLFADTRRFGRLWLVQANELDKIGGLTKLGPEPIDEDFDFDLWQQRTHGKGKSKMKPLILDQTVVAGLGNIYADEVLFAAHIHPEARLADVSEEQQRALVSAMRDTLNAAIAARGTTFRDYVDGSGERGEYQNKLRVFQKEGEACPNCGNTIVRIKVAGRGTCLCPHCQQLKTQE